MALKRGIVVRLFAVCAGLCIVRAAIAVEPVSRAERHWLPLTKDELHDPAMNTLKVLQNPDEALSKLPRSGAGNQVDWAKALENGYIKPHVNIRSGTEIKVLDLDVLRQNTGEMDMVLFPHKQHTEWLVCSNCHEELFKSKAGATRFGMFDILNGEYCGRCHGAVAFPLTECKRCHNVPRLPITIPAPAH
jgi:c(7)-type cytochrome triheme protein